MKLHTKVSLIVAVSLAALTLVICVVTETLIASSYQQLEKRENDAMLARGRAAIDKLLAGVRRTAIDYAHWTDTYDFLTVGSPGYVETNMVPASMANLELDAFLLTDVQGGLRQGAVGEGFEQAALAPLAEGLNDLARQAAAGRETVDLVRLPDGRLLMVAASPVLRNDHSGPPAGALLHVRVFDDEVADEIASVVLLPVRVTAPGEPAGFAPEEQAARDTGMVVATELTNRGGQSVARLHLQVQRDIYHHGRDLRHTYYILFAVLILAAGFIIAVLLRVRVLDRLQRIVEGVRSVAAERDMSRRIAVKGDDELAALSEGINHMLHELQDAGEKEHAARMEKEKLTDQLIRSQKMEALGTLVGGMAHDFNNMLGCIVSLVGMLKVEGGLSPRQTEHLDRIEESAFHGASIIRQLGSFGRQRPTERALQHLCGVVSDAVRMVRSAVPKCIELRSEHTTTEDVVLMDENQIKQVVVNLVTNASQAIGLRSGHIVLRVEEAALPDPAWPQAHALPPGDYLRLSVTDDGGGISPENMERIFDPFFTTKDVGQGTGLGLSVVHGIIAAHGGTIEVRSLPGQGATFVIHLPSSRMTIATTAAKAGRPAASGNHILLVEDDDLVRESVVVALQKQGYAVTEAKDGAEGWDVFQEQAGKFDLVLVDQQMPRLSGTRLTLRIHSRAPDMPVILLSGYLGNLDDKELQACGFRAIVDKPFTSAQLAAVVRDNLLPAAPVPVVA